MKKKPIIIAAVVLAILVVVTAVVCIAASASSSGPLGKVEKAVDKSYSAAEKGSSEAVKQAESLMNGGSIEVNGNLKRLLKEIVGISMDLDASAKLYFNAQDKAMAAGMTLSMDDEPIVDGTFVLDSKKTALTSDTLLGGSAYGLTFADALEKFDDSVFGPDGEYSLGFEASDLEDLMEEVAGASEDFMKTFSAMLEEAPKKAEKLIKTADDFREDFVKMLLKTVQKNAEVKQTSGNLQISKDRINTYDISVAMEGEELQTILMDVVSFMIESKDLEKLFAEAWDIMEPVLSMGDVDGELEDMYDEMLDALEDMSDELEDLDFDDIEFLFVFHVSKSNKELIGLEVEMETDGAAAAVEAKFGPSMADIDQIFFEIEIDEDTDDSGKPSVVTFEYLVSEDSKNGFSASVELASIERGYDYYYDESYEYTEAFEAEVEWDKKNGDFEISLRDGNGMDLFSFEGLLQAEKKRTVLTLDSISVEGESLSFGDLQVILNYSDRMPEIKKYTDVLDMDEGDVEDLMDGVQETVMALAEYLY